MIESRRRSDLITPVPKPKKRKAAKAQTEMVLDSGDGLSTADQEYNPTPIINKIRGHVESWRNLPNPNDWGVTPETARLLQHWRHHPFQGVRPFFCQIEAVETAIWLTEVAPQKGDIWKHVKGANEQANPELLRMALKLATGAGKTTVMAMLIAWQTVNAVRHPDSKRFSKGFLIVAPGITIRDRLRVLLPNDPESYFRHREIVPNDMLRDIAVWFIDTDYNEESFFVRHAYFLGANDPYKSLKTTLKAEIDREAWDSPNSDTSRPFDKPTSGRIAVKVINHLGDEVMKVFSVG